MKPDDLDRALTEMTVWKGVEPDLWKAALKSDEAKPEGGGWKLDSILSKPLSNRLMLGAVACIALVFVVGAMLPSLGKARGVSEGLVTRSELGADLVGEARWLELSAAAPQTDRMSDGKVRAEEGRRVYGAVGDRARADFLAGSHAVMPDAVGIPELQDAKPAAVERYVVQKATMDLQTDDVRAAFAKAAHLVSEAGGEFVENSSLTGDGKAAQGNLTLRVAAARVGEVMNKLRELGTVKSENTSGEDVTTQVVDVEARIRNELRVEKELLDLLEKRHDAPLKDILELRSSLSSVRESIERLVGQRDRLGRLVSLASILVVIRAEPLIEKPAPASTIGDYFTKAVDRAWHGGLQSLSDTVAWIIAAAIGGVMWWIALTAVVVAILRWRRRLSARCV